jgi:aconitate hydratase
MTTRATLSVEGQPYTYYSLPAAETQGLGTIDRLPFSIRVLLENMLRVAESPDGATLLGAEAEATLRALANWQPQPEPREIPLMPARVILQDFTGVPCVVDLVAMRDAMQARGKDPQRINPVVPADLVIDHSVQVDYFGTQYAFFLNVEKEFERNRERYMLLRWAQRAFDGFRVVPPGTGIVHQVNLEYLGKVVQTKQVNGEVVAFPDSLVGTDSHTTMINALGILGWGVGGIEAEAVMLGQPYYMLIPQVVGVKLTGELPEGATATDLVLTVTQMLRKKGVVDKFVEFYGPGLSSLTVEDRATIANMAPEYGATMGFFPVDQRTLEYLRFTGRHESLVRLVEAYCKENALFRTDETPDPEYSDTLELDLSTVEPSLAGPKRPHDRVPLREMQASFRKALYTPIREGGFGLQPHEPSRVGRRVACGGHACRAWACGRARRAGRRGDLPQARRCGHRGDYLLHEHLEPRSDGRGGAAGEESRRARAAGQAVGEDEPCARQPRGVGLLGERGVAAVSGGVALPCGRLRLHNLHRQQRSPAARDFGGGQAGRLGGRGGAVGQPQLRGAHQPAGEGELPRLAAAGGRLRHRWHGGHRPVARPAGLGSRTATLCS